MNMEPNQDVWFVAQLSGGNIFRLLPVRYCQRHSDTHSVINFDDKHSLVMEDKFLFLTEMEAIKFMEEQYREQIFQLETDLEIAKRELDKVLNHDTR